MWRLNVALHERSMLVAASLPRTSRKKRAFLPSRSGGAASAGGGLAPAMHAPPPLSMRDLTRGKAKAPRAPSVAFRIVQGSVLPFWRCAVRLLQRPRTQEQRAPCLRRTCCLAWGLSSLSFASEGASNGQRVEEAWL